MHPGRRPLRVASPGRLLVICSLLSVLPVSRPGQLAANIAAGANAAAAARQPAAARSHAGEAPSESWLITWDASTAGSGTYEGWTVSRQSHVTASIVVNYYADDTSDYYVDEYTATYLLDAVDSGPCPGGGGYRKHFRHEITDPAHYSGAGPITPNTVMPYKPTPWVGARWTVNMVNLVLGGIEGYNRYDAILCGGDRENWYETSEGFWYTEHLTSDTLTMFNSDDGPLFLYDVDAAFDVTDYAVTYPLHLVEHVRVERLTGLDLTVRDIEVTQGLQLQNTIPLVQGRRTIVRAYIGIGTVPGPVEGVDGRLRVYAGATLLGELRPFNMAGSISARRAPDWRKIDDTLNFELPWTWTYAPSLRFEVEVNPTCRVSEVDCDNNTRSVELPLRDCAPLNIRYLRVRYAPPGATPASPDDDIAIAHEFMRKFYPVADNELFYEPWPGITWNEAFDGSGEPWEAMVSSQRLLEKLAKTVPFSQGTDVTGVKVVGWMPDGVSVWHDGEADAIPGKAAWLQQKKTRPYNIWRVLLAHELGHTYGLYHPFGFAVSLTNGYHWFDVYERTIKPAGEWGLFDFMIDSPSQEPSQWARAISYNGLYWLAFCGGSTPRAAQPRTAADVLVVSGDVSLTTTQSGQLDPLVRTPGSELIPPAGSSYYVVLKNGTTELARYGFDADPEVQASEVYTPTSGPFVLAVPYPAGLNRVDLADRDGNVLSSRTPSAHPPAVTVQFPNAIGLTLDGVETIEWAGSDLDNDNLTYNVLYSVDNGATWNAIGVDITESNYAADFAAIPGSSTALIKVLASDGFDTASDVSDQPFAVPAKPPVAAIVSPPADAHFKVGELIKLQGYAVDLEEGMAASGSLSWSSDLDGALGAGDRLEVTLSEGTHTITLDASGGAASVTTTVVVETPPPPPEKSYTYLPLLLR